MCIAILVVACWAPGVAQATDWPAGDRVLSPAGFRKAFDKWMSRWRLATRKAASEIEAETGRDISTWCLLKAKWIRIDVRDDARHYAAAEEWSDENSTTFQATAERLGVVDNTPKGYPKKTDFSHDKMNQGEAMLKRKPLPRTERTARMDALRKREKRQAVHPWVVVIAPEELGLLETDARLVDLVGDDPVIEVNWNRRSAFENVADAKPLPQRFMLRLIGAKLTAAPGATCHVTHDVLIGQSRPQTLQGKKVQVFDALVIDIDTALREVNEQVKADELDQPLAQPEPVKAR